MYSFHVLELKMAHHTPQRKTDCSMKKKFVLFEYCVNAIMVFIITKVLILTASPEMRSYTEHPVNTRTLWAVLV